MGKYLKVFQNNTEYNSFTGSEYYIKPNVSNCIYEKEVHYNPYYAPLKIIYDVTDASHTTSLYTYYDSEGDEDNWIKGTELFDKIEIDGTEVSISDIDSADGKYLLTAGEHTVQYTLKDPSYIKEYAFYGCTDIKELYIPKGVTRIGEGAFYECSNIETISIPKSVKYIEYESFGGYDIHVKNLNIDTTVIDTWFSGMKWLESIKLGSNVRTIVDGAFMAGVDVNQDDRAAIERINSNAFCETYVITATFPQSSQKVALGNYAIAYYINGTRIPYDEIIIER